MKTTYQNGSRTAVQFLPPPLPQRVLQVSGLPMPVRIVWNTPRQFWAFAAAIVTASALFCFAASHSITRSRDAIKSVGNDCAPSIIAAQQIRSWFADFDANEANLLLCDPSSNEGIRSKQAADQRHRQISDALVTAAKNITFVDKERPLVVGMVNGFAAYEALMSKAHTLQEKGDTANALVSARQATSVLQDTVIPAADALDRANTDELESVYARQRFHAQGAITILVISGLITLGLLVIAQIYLIRRTHRLLNPALLAATVITLFQLVNSTVQSVHAAHHLRKAVDDAFASVHFLWKARALGFDANGEESRYLFDREPQQAAAAERAFQAKTATIANIPPGESYTSIANTVRLKKPLPRDFTGLLANELGNLSFPGERDAAIDALNTFHDYMAVDEKIRSFEKSGKHAEAVRLCVSYDDGGSNAAFDDYDHALEKVIRINQTEFDAACADSATILASGEWIIGIATILAIAGTLAGFWPRIREYQV